MTYDPKSAGSERYVDLINNFTRSFSSRPTPSTRDPYPFGFNTSTGYFEYWNGASWVQAGAPSVDHGLLEPGLIDLCDPYYLQNAGYGFDAGNPAFLVTNRNLYTSEDIRLLVLEEGGGDPVIIAQPATILMTIPLQDTPQQYLHIFHFTVQPGFSLVTFTGENFLMAVLGIYDNDESRWVDKISLLISPSGPF